MTLSRLLLVLLLTAGAWAVTSILAVPEAAASCIHQGRRVNCPPGVADGSRSLRFNNGGIVWSDGTTTPRSACCTPATANGPATGGPSTPPTTPTTGTPPSTTPATGGPPPGDTPTTGPGVAGDTRTQFALTIPRLSDPGLSDAFRDLRYSILNRGLQGQDPAARVVWEVDVEGLGLGPSRVEAARNAHRQAFRAVTAAVGDRLQYFGTAAVGDRLQVFSGPLGALTLDPELGTISGGFRDVRNDVIDYIYFQLRGGSLLTPETIAQLQPVLQPLLQEEARAWQELREAYLSADPVRAYPGLNMLGLLLEELTFEGDAPGPGGGSAVDRADAEQAPAVFPPPGDDTPVDQVM
jgi:hypothetical protein